MFSLIFFLLYIDIFGYVEFVLDALAGENNAKGRSEVTHTLSSVMLKTKT